MQFLCSLVQPQHVWSSHAKGGEECLIVVAWLHLAITNSARRRPGEFDVLIQLAQALVLCSGTGHISVCWKRFSRLPFRRLLQAGCEDSAALSHLQGGW